MNDEQAREDLRIIKEMLEKTRRQTAESGPFFVFWGVLILLAFAGTYILGFLHLFKWIWLNWTIAAVIGWIVSILYGIKKKKSRPVTTYPQSAANYLGIGSGTGFLLACLVFPLLNVYSYEVIPIVFGLVAGINMFVMGGIFEWNFLKWFGLFWWLAAIGQTQIPGRHRFSVLVLLFIIGYMVPSLILWAKYRREKEEQ